MLGIGSFQTKFKITWEEEEEMLLVALIRVRGQNKVSFPDEAFWMIEVSKICYLIAERSQPFWLIKLLTRRELSFWDKDPYKIVEKG